MHFGVKATGTTICRPDVFYCKTYTLYLPYPKQNSFKNARLRHKLAPKNKYDIIVSSIMPLHRASRNKERTVFEAHWSKRIL